MTVQNIFDFLNSRFPVDTACGFDNVGTLVGDRNKTVTKAIIALDCTVPVINEAVKNGCELIITHHPVIFNGIKSVLDDTLVYEIIKNGLSVISMHTNLDQGCGGVNDALCSAIGLKEVEAVTANDGFIIRKGAVSPISADKFASHLKTVLNYPVRHVGEKEIKNVLVCGGAGADYLNIAQQNGCDALVTSDVRHHQFLEAAHKGILLFECGHFNTEVVVIKPLCEMLKAEFPEILFFENTASQIKTAK
jgi:dinuclear metal center YbgI/SA1388 family protein